MKTKIATAAEGRQQPTNTHEPLSLVSLTRPPLDPLKREEIGEQIWIGIHLRFQQSLSDDDRALWSRPPERPEESREHLRLLRAFDEFLLGQFAEFGWRLLMSVGVLHRVSEWEKHAPDLLSRLGKQLELRSMVLRGSIPSTMQNGGHETPSVWTGFAVCGRNFPVNSLFLASSQYLLWR